jgi:hypothetical protein
MEGPPIPCKFSSAMEILHPMPIIKGPKQKASRDMPSFSPYTSKVVSPKLGLLTIHIIFII